MSTANITMHPYTATTHARRDVCNKITGTIGAIFVTAVASMVAQYLFSSYVSLDTRVYTLGAALVLCVPLMIAIAVSVFFENKLNACIEEMKDVLKYHQELDPKLKLNEDFIEKLIQKRPTLFSALDETMRMKPKIEATHLLGNFKTWLDEDAVHELDSTIELFKRSDSYRKASSQEARDQAYLEFVNKTCYFRAIVSEVPTTKAQALSYVESDPTVYLRLSQALKGDKDIALLAVRKRPIYFCAVPILTRMRSDIIEAYKTGIQDVINS